MKNYDFHVFHAPRGCLSYLISDLSTNKAVLIDPSKEMIEEYNDYITTHNIKLSYVIETHTHADHISYSKDLKNEHNAKIVMHKNAPSKNKDVAVDNGDIIKIGSLDLKILHTPGHTNDSISIYFDDKIFTGDALLIGGTGRTDFQQGSSEALYDSLWNKILLLPTSTTVHPAHNYKGLTSSTIEDEKQNNPRLQMDKKEFIMFMNNHHPSKPELFEKSINANS